MNQLFISYSRKNTEFARRINQRFEDEKISAWVDWQDIPPSVDWTKEIRKGIEEADIFLLLVSPDSISSPVVSDELAHAVLNGKRIIPVVVQDIDSKIAPASISHLNWVFFSRPEDDFEDSFNRILLAIRTDYEWAQTHKRLQMKALEWERGQWEESYLLRGKDLQDAEAQLLVNDRKDPRPTELQRTYIAKSSEFEKKQQEEKRLKEQQLELEKKLGTRLRQVTYLMIGVFTVAYAILFVWLNTVTSNLAVQSIKNQMLALVETSVCFINVNADGYQEYIEYFSAGDQAAYQDEWYSYIFNLLEDIKATNKNIETDVELYTITQGRAADEFLFVVATNNTIEYKTASSGNSLDNVHIAGMNKTTVDTQIYTDEYGTWISACSPIFNSSGISVGALCADFSAEFLEFTRQKVTTTLSIAFLAIYPAMILLVFFTTRSFQKRRNDTKKNNT